MNMLMKTVGLPVAVLTLAACGPLPGSQALAQKDQTAPAAQIEEFQIDDARINESSGLARSQRDDELLWTMNDSGGKAQLYAMDTHGHFRGTLQLRPALNLDWEDVTSFVEDGTPRLLAGDMGDNNAFRPFLTFYIVEEPETAGLAEPFVVNTTPLRQIQWMYPDGPRDAESVAVDAQEGYVYVLSKRDAVPKLYRAPLNPLAPLVVAEDLGEIEIPRAPADAPNPESINWVTSMDIDNAARRLVALTLTRAYVYVRGDGESWIDALRRAPVAVDLPDFPQMEAVAFAADGTNLYLTSEGEPAPMARVPLPVAAQ